MSNREGNGTYNNALYKIEREEKRQEVIQHHVLPFEQGCSDPGNHQFESNVTHSVNLKIAWAKPWLSTA